MTEDTLKAEKLGWRSFDVQYDKSERERGRERPTSREREKPRRTEELLYTTV